MIKAPVVARPPTMITNILTLDGRCITLRNDGLKPSITAGNQNKNYCLRKTKEKIDKIFPPTRLDITLNTLAFSKVSKKLCHHTI
jgi:hypothetical protein